MTKEELRIRLGANIQRERKARRMSRAELGKHLNIVEGTVGLMERGERGATFLTLYKLADIFEVPIDAFFYGMQTNEDAAGRRRKSLTNMLTGLSEKQLEYIIQMVKGIRDLELSGG